MLGILILSMNNQEYKETLGVLGVSRNYQKYEELYKEYQS
jgi:hypothetical protein